MKKILSIMCTLLLTIATMAQTVEDVTLVTSGSASTEQEATLVALRSAIEQTFGTFVSSNTTMVNDELIKDEIVSVSKGNVQKYKKLSTNILPNGQVSVSVEATISISKLISYAKSKGSQAEFAGQTFVMNKKLMELRTRNTVAAYKNMIEECILLAKDAFDFQVELGVPSGAVRTIEADNSDRVQHEQGYYIPLKIKILANSVLAYISHLYWNTMESLKLSDEEIEDYIKLGAKFYTLPVLHILRGFKKTSVKYEKFVLLSNDMAIDERLNRALYESMMGQEFENADKRLNRALYESTHRYKLIDTSNPQCYFEWYNQLTPNIFLTSVSKDVFKSNLRKPGENSYLCDSYGVVIARDGLQPYERIGISSDPNVLSWIRDFVMFPPRELYEKLPKYEKITSSSKRQRNKSGKNDEQRLITTDEIKLFIPENSMANFTGITLELQ